MPLSHRRGSPRGNPDGHQCLQEPTIPVGKGVDSNCHQIASPRLAFGPQSLQETPGHVAFDPLFRASHDGLSGHHGAAALGDEEVRSSSVFEEKVALSLAAIATLALSITHLALSQFTEMFASIMQGHNLTLLIVYTLFCFVVAMVPYRINLNIRRRIEREAIIEERRRIAREIHDGVAQSLSYLNLKTKAVSDSLSSQNTVQALTELGEIREVVQDTYEDIRESIEQLSTEIRSVPIITALGNYVREFGNNSAIRVQFNVAKPFTKLSPVAELQLLRIVQEALTNVRRHAMASEVEVKLENTRESVEMLVKDNGQGFNLMDVEKSPPGYHGLSIIKERAEGLGGSLNISTASGKGTEIKISLPVEKVRL